MPGLPLSNIRSYRVATYKGLLTRLQKYGPIDQGSGIIRTGQPLTEFIIIIRSGKKGNNPAP